MTKIITYTDRKGGFSRKADGTDDIVEKKKGKDETIWHRERIGNPWIILWGSLDTYINPGSSIFHAPSYVIRRLYFLYGDEAALTLLPLK